MSFTSKNLSTSFDSRDSYIKYVSLWKSTYAELSQEIRTAKLTRRDANRAFSSDTASHHKLYAPLVISQARVESLKEKANSLLEERKLSKVEAGIQYVKQE